MESRRPKNIGLSVAIEFNPRNWRMSMATEGNGKGGLWCDWHLQILFVYVGFHID